MSQLVSSCVVCINDLWMNRRWGANGRKGGPVIKDVSSVDGATTLSAQYFDLGEWLIFSIESYSSVITSVVHVSQPSTLSRFSHKPQLLPLVLAQKTIQIEHRPFSSMDVLSVPPPAL